MEIIFKTHDNYLSSKPMTIIYNKPMENYIISSFIYIYIYKDPSNKQKLYDL